MQKLVVSFAVLSLIPLSGCATVSEVVIDGVFNSIFDDDESIDPKILARKGIKLGSKEARRLEFETNFQKDMDEQWKSGQ